MVDLPTTTAPLQLSRATLSALPAHVVRPLYDPALVKAGIVHLGLGNFHRSHMARYTHALIGQDVNALQWGIMGAGLLAVDRRLYDALAPQDWLYSLVERDQTGDRSMIVGSLCGMLLADPDSKELLSAIDGVGIHIVSLTVTERGYCLNPATKQLDYEHPAIAADLLTPRHPHSAIGILVEALRRRMVAARPAFSAMSCDNIQHNGDVLRAAVLAYADRSNPELGRWIADHARFPNTMVDRITPSTSAQDIATLARHNIVMDAAPLFCEPFSQWVIEDDFADGRPDWQAVGAQFVADVAPFEKMKLRLLNASHLALAAIGTLMGYTLVSDAMGDPDLADYIGRLMANEAAPTLDPVPGVDIVKYQSDVIARFANPRIIDTLARINDDAPLNYLLDPVRDRLAWAEPIDLFALAIAAWLMRLHEGDPSGDSTAMAFPDRHSHLFGSLLADPAFTDAVRGWLDRVDLKQRPKAEQMRALLIQAAALSPRVPPS